MEFAGESTVGAKGAVNPLFFDYPNQGEAALEASKIAMKEVEKWKFVSHFKAKNRN